MNLDLPEGAHVQIIIAPARGAAMLREPLLAPPPPAAPRPRHLLLKGAVVAALIGVAFVAGQRTAPAGRPVQLARAQSYQPAPYQRPFIPGRTAEIPPAFRQRLQTPPRLTPPPGAAAPGVAPGKDGFGMEN